MAARKFKPQDADVILSWLNALRSSSFNWTAEALESELKNTETWVLDEQNKVHAFVCERQTPEAIEWTVLATLPGGTRQGSMKRLLTSRIADLRAAKAVSQIWLEVHEKNLGAVKLYENLGFQNTGRRPKYYTDGAAALLFSKKI